MKTGQAMKIAINHTNIILIAVAFLVLQRNNYKLLLYGEQQPKFKSSVVNLNATPQKSENNQFSKMCDIDSNLVIFGLCPHVLMVIYLPFFAISGK